MKITAIDDLHADGGWRTVSFLKISTDDGEQARDQLRHLEHRLVAVRMYTLA